MVPKIFRSSFFICFSIVLFSLFLVSNTFPDSWTLQSQEWEKEFQVGIEFYNEGRFTDAIEHFNRVLSLTQDGSVLATVHYNLSICFYYSGDMDAAEESIKNLLKLDPSREASETFPNKYKKLFTKAKKELLKESGPETLEETLRAETEETPYRAKAADSKKKKRNVILIAGGAALAAVVATTGFIVLSSNKGSIQCNSTPSGASVLLDGSSTGQVTPCTIDDVEPGSHTVILALDGYVNYQQSVNVEKRKTINVTSSLTPHTINISNPGNHAVWAKGQTYTIIWNVGGTLSLQNIPLRTFSSPSFAFSPDLRRISPALSNSSSGRETLDQLLRQSRTHTSGERSNAIAGGEQRTATALRYMNDPHDFMMRGSRVPSAGERRDGFLSGGQLPNPSFQNPQGRIPTALANVTIDLYRGGGKVMGIAPNTANNGSYSWQAPGDSVANAGDYKIRISASTDPSVYGESDYFYVSHTGSLNSTSNPAGAAIHWDGWNSGQTTDTILTLPVGSRAVKYTRSLFRDFETDVNILQDQTVNLHKDMDPDSFFEDFSDNQAQFWTPVAGSATWIAEDGVFKFKSVRGSSEEQVGFYKAGSGKIYGNFTYEVDGERAIGEPWNVLGITIGVEPNHYRFILLDLSPGNQMFSIWYQRATGGQQGTLTGWTPFAKIYAFGKNDLKIIRDGSTLYFYVNEYEVAKHVISYMEDWCEVGLWGYTESLSSEVHFDNIRLTLHTASLAPRTDRTSAPPSKVTYNNDAHPAYPPGIIKKKIN